MSETFGSAAAVLRFAIEREREAAAGYADLAAKSRAEGPRRLLLELRAQEIEHERLLRELDASRLPGSGRTAVPDLKISDYAVEEPLGDEPSFQDLLLFAARKEAKAAALYEALSGREEDASRKALFEFLSGQEKTHKLRLEQEYESLVLPED
jgi:rubrerythrin